VQLALASVPVLVEPVPVVSTVSDQVLALVLSVQVPAPFLTVPVLVPVPFSTVVLVLDPVPFSAMVPESCLVPDLVPASPEADPVGVCSLEPGLVYLTVS